MFRIRQDHLRDHLPDRHALIRCLTRLGRGALTALFPDKCLVCGAYIRCLHDLAPVSDNLEALFESTLARVVCSKCLEQGFTPVLPPLCTCCGKPFLSRAGENHLCFDCIKAAQTGRFMVGRARAFAAHDLLLRDLVHLFKYGKKICLARPLGRLMFHAFMRHFACSAIDLVLPVPLHTRRLRQRGFNQAYLLVRDFPSMWKQAVKHPPGWTISNTILLRSRNTPSQTGFDRKNRLKNLRGAFTVRGTEKIEGRRILLIDDVFTTGATSGEAALTLFKAGALSVDLLVLARA
ncbi:ComF [Desulforapulum autotrophicum HRM2]|uniref:ComF n=1 Tax=Desulforapulum autotrophicum (strain ATCC 43914 / DSM 3382 / VKM B-1955 / HRM2) TaxID=177437 RepID=C0QBT9_DESAH|nr:ComF family protein [Desulforapulum autotrophicum]ACN14951.1 ComF [Desulforapulum autotrophicum HRM2]